MRYVVYPERPVKGQVAHIVGQVGATFAFPSEVTASIAESAERASGAEELTRFTYIVPFDGMTWDEVADHACTWGPQGDGS